MSKNQSLENQKLLLEAQQESQNPPDFYDIVIPGEIRNIKELNRGDQDLYGVIRNHWKRKGYCWATNETLAERSGCKIREVQKRLRKLEASKVVVTEQFQVGKLKFRRLWNPTEFQKMFRDVQMDTPPCPNGHPPSSERSIIRDTGRINTIKPSNAIILNKETGKFENLSQEEIKELKEMFPAVQVENEIRKCENWAKDYDRKNYRKSIRTWMENKQKNNTTPYVKPESKEQAVVTDDDIMVNTKIAKDLEKQLQEKNIPNYAIYAKADKVEFIYPNDQSLEVSTHLPKEEFLKLCQPAKIRMHLK
jgi:hypothetical protein